MAGAELRLVFPTGERLRIELPGGIAFPDWSAVRSNRVEAALTDIFEAFGVEKSWSGMSDDEDRVRRAILREYGRTGRAPDAARLARTAPLSPEKLYDVLLSLQRRDFVVLDDDGGWIVGAYPLTDRETGHVVHIGSTAVNAMCAIDALGVGAMYRLDTAIESHCCHCGAPVRVHTRAGGREIASASPSDIVVWSGIQETHGCSADTMCTMMAFFCSAECLGAWLEDDAAGATGHRLSLDEGLQTGRAIFTPLLG